MPASTDPPPRHASPARVLYDGECGLCRALAGQVQLRVSGGTLELAAYQTQDKSDLPAGISTNDLERALQVVLPDGSVRQRADAVFEVMRALPRPWSRLARWGGWPPIRWAANALYEPLARHRQVWSRWLRLDRTPLP